MFHVSKRRLVRGGIVLALLSGALVVSNRYRAQAQDNSDNPYVQLYQLRIVEAEANVQRQQALDALAQAKLSRGKALFSRNAIAREELDTLVSEAGVTAADSILAGKKVEEAKAYLKIIDSLVARGVSIPLCTYETE